MESRAYLGVEMRDWFPLTNYEFYAFVASGMLLVATIDYCFADGVLVHRPEWTLVQIVFWTVISYVAGHICAAPASAIIEHFIARTIFREPGAVALRLEERRWREYALAWAFAHREYAPFNSATLAGIRKAFITRAGGKLDQIITTHAIFEMAYPLARQNQDTAQRLESFQNTYGFCRNICFVALVAAGCLTYRYWQTKTDWDLWLTIGAVATSVGMYGRFLKYYALFGREVLLRFYAQTHETGEREA